jgi:hypothetical protein
MASYYDRYEEFRFNGEVKPIPGIKLEPKGTDKTVVYELGKTRLDILSQKYYGNPWHGFLILLANPQFGGLEFNIPDGQIIRVPFPFKTTLEQYIAEVEKHRTLYGD